MGTLALTEREITQRQMNALTFFCCVYLLELLSNVNPSKMLIFKQLGDERSSKLWQ